MKKRLTPRGFGIAEFEDRNGHACSIQESSIATEACLWLGVDTPDVAIPVSKSPEPGFSWWNLELPKNVMCSGRMHLTQEHVRELLPLLTHFAETGQLPRLDEDDDA